MSAKLGGKAKNNMAKEAFRVSFAMFSEKTTPVSFARRIFYSFMPNFADV